MRRNKKKIVSFKTQLTPWQLQTIDNTDRHFQDSFTSIALFHSIHSTQEPVKTHKNIQITISPLRPQINKQRLAHSPFVHCKTLSVIKDYCKKNYIEPDQQKKSSNRKCRSVQTLIKRICDPITKIRQQSAKKASIVDLSRSFMEQLRPATRVSVPKTRYGSRLLKIKQELRKQKKLHDKKQIIAQNLIYSDLRPQSRSMPLRCLTRFVPSKTKKTIFPKQNFGELLHQYLEKN